MFTPNDAWTVTAAVDYFKDSGTGNIALMQTPRPGEDLYSALVDTAGFLDQDNLAYRLRADFRPTENIELSYIGGKSEMERRNASDNDGGATLGFKQEHRTEWSSFDSYSHELTVKSIGDSRLEWIAGAFLMHEENAIRFDIDISQIDAAAGSGVIVVNPTAADRHGVGDVVHPAATARSIRNAAFAQGDLRHHRLAARHRRRALHRRRERRPGRTQLGVPAVRRDVGSGGHLIGPGGEVSVATCDSEYAPGTWPGGGANDGKTEDEKTTWLARLEYDINDDDAQLRQRVDRFQVRRSERWRTPPSAGGADQLRGRLQVRVCWIAP